MCQTQTNTECVKDKCSAGQSIENFYSSVKVWLLLEKMTKMKACKYKISIWETDSTQNKKVPCKKMEISKYK